MALFEERGFEDTSVVEIAERARVTTRTFFRYFADKRAVLFAEADDLRDALVEDLRRAPDVGEPLAAVIEVLAAFDWEGRGREIQRARQAVIAANPELLERDLIKRDGIAVALADVLRQRGVDADVAQVAARVGTQVFLVAYEEWLGGDGDAGLAAITRRTVSHLGRLMPTGTTIPS
jgi:AcrR family transcriptional regulator